MTVSALSRNHDALNPYDGEIDDNEFFELCQRNPGFKLEKNQIVQ